MRDENGNIIDASATTIDVTTIVDESLSKGDNLVAVILGSVGTTIIIAFVIFLILRKKKSKA